MDLTCHTLWCRLASSRYLLKSPSPSSSVSSSGLHHPRCASPPSSILSMSVLSFPHFLSSSLLAVHVPAHRIQPHRTHPSVSPSLLRFHIIQSYISSFPDASFNPFSFLDNKGVSRSIFPLAYNYFSSRVKLRGYLFSSRIGLFYSLSPRIWLGPASQPAPLEHYIHTYSLSRKKSQLLYRSVKSEFTVKNSVYRQFFSL